MKNKTDGALLKKCLVEIRRCEPAALWMAVGLGIMEAFIPLGTSLLAALLVDGLERGDEYTNLISLAALGVTVLFVMNAVRG